MHREITVCTADALMEHSPKDFKAFTDYLHEHHQHYVPIVDGAISILFNKSDVYDTYSRGKELDVSTRNALTAWWKCRWNILSDRSSSRIRTGANTLAKSGQGERK